VDALKKKMVDSAANLIGHNSRNGLNQGAALFWNRFGFGWQKLLRARMSSGSLNPRS